MKCKKKKSEKEQIFISYARKDNKDHFAERLCKDLRDRGFKGVWLDTETFA